MIELIYADGTFRLKDENVRFDGQETCDVSIEINKGTSVPLKCKTLLLDKARMFINEKFGVSYQNIGIGSNCKTEEASVDVLRFIDTRMY